MGTGTPWGTSDYSEQVARGIMVYGTPSHGGYHLSKTRNAKVHSVWKRGDDYMNKQRASGWYEEDCDWAIVAYTFPELFSAEQLAHACWTLKHYCPHDWMAVTGMMLTPADSRVLLEEEHARKHAEDWVVSCAWGDWHDDVPSGMVGVATTKGVRPAILDGQKQRYFLVPKDEYRRPRGLSFVVDPARHLEITPIP